MNAIYKAVISPIYGLDAAAEAVFIIWWLACLALTFRKALHWRNTPCPT